MTRLITLQKSFPPYGVQPWGMVEYIVEYGALEIVKHFLSTALSFAIVEYEVLLIVALFVSRRPSCGNETGTAYCSPLVQYNRL